MHPHEQFGHHLLPILIKSKRVLVTGTEGPDGDSVGSMIAMAHAAQHHGARVTMYTPEPMPPTFAYLKNHLPFLTELAGSLHDYHLVIIVDTGDVKRSPLAEAMTKRDPKKTTVVNIDHHLSVIHHEGKLAVDHNYNDTKAASTTEIIFSMLKAMQVPITPKIATALLTGILTDTGHFSNAATNAHAVDVAADLMSRGARHDIITKATMQSKSLGALKLWGRALSRLKMNLADGTVSTMVTLKDFAECGADEDATTGIANFLNTLSEGKIALVLQEAPNGIVKGSYRTTSDVNVAELARKYGGGGHPKAAGFKVKGRIVEQTDGWVIEPAS